MFATTRASPEGDFRIRRIEPSGSSSIIVDDARQPALSPSGDRLAFASLVLDRFQIALMPIDRPDEVQLLTHGVRDVGLPVWSPDGDRLAFVTLPLRDDVHFDRFSGPAELWMLDLHCHATRLTRGGSIELATPVWTRDGIWILSRASGRPGDASGAVVYRVTLQ